MAASIEGAAYRWTLHRRSPWRSWLRSLAALVLVSSVQTKTWASDFDIHWTELTNDTFDAHLKTEGQSNFSVNALPIPTYTIPGMYWSQLRCDVYDVSTGRCAVVRTWQGNQFHGSFSRVLLRSGKNDFYFGYSFDLPMPQGGFTEHTVTLNGPSGLVATLFHVIAQSGPYEGATSINLSLRQIDPTLADDISRLESELQGTRYELIKNASNPQELATRLAQVDQLQADLDHLIAQGFGAIDELALDSLVAKYAFIDGAARDALLRTVADLKSSVETLYFEIERIRGDFARQADAVTAVALQAARNEGFEPTNPANYVTRIDPASLPQLAVPDLTPNGFNPADDPYARYAADILGQLQGAVAGDAVVDPELFLEIMEGWRKNMEVVELALKLQGSSSTEEWGAFLNSKNQVVSFISRYVDPDGWFKGSVIRPSVKQAVGGPIAAFDPEAAKRLKHALNLWHDQMTARHEMVLQTIEGLGGGVGALGLEPSPYAEDLEHIHNALNALVDIAEVVARVGAGFVPFVGDTLDFCEAITGRAWCDPSGEELSTGERVLSGLGVVVGSRMFWQGVAQAAGVVGVVVATKTSKVLEHLEDLTIAERKLLLKRIGGTVAHLDDITGREIIRLTDKLGELLIMQLAPALKGTGLQELEKLAFFKLTPTARAASATKGAALKALPPSAWVACR